LLSGEGTSLENLIERIARGEVPGRVVLVLASKQGAGGLARARRHGIPAMAVPRKQFRDSKAFNDALHAELERQDPELVLLLGFLSPFETRGRYDGRALNVHPALIPAFCGKGFYGERVHRAVLEYGAKLTGATIHYCDEQYDSGPIILQHAIPVLEDDTPASLATRVAEVERALYPRAIQLHAQGRLRIEGRRVRILPPSSS
jgi:phosphoribosylglycinamide formyltransferase-1